MIVVVMIVNIISINMNVLILILIPILIFVINISMAPAGGGGQLEKVFKAAVGFLEEGSLDARTYGKRIIWQVGLPSPPLLHPSALYGCCLGCIQMHFMYLHLPSSS